MKPDRAILHLTLIVESVDAIRAYMSEHDEAGFLADQLCKDAVAMRLQVIGEAARMLTAEERAEATDIAWSQIVALRHRIAHAYRTIDFPLVWQIVNSELGALRVAAQRMLAARGA